MSPGLPGRMARREHGPGAVDAGDHRPAAHDRALVRDRERVLVVERRVLDAHRDVAFGQAGFVDAANRGAKAGVVLLEQQGLEHGAGLLVCATSITIAHSRRRAPPGTRVGRAPLRPHRTGGTIDECPDASFRSPRSTRGPIEGWRERSRRGRARWRRKATGSSTRWGRGLRDLRISVTDRCNFRCSYCMPKEVFDKHYAFLPQSSLLTFEEIVRARAAVRRPWRAQDPPHRRRAAAAPRPRAAGRDAGRAAQRRRRAARPDADDQRLDPRAQGRGAEGRGAAAASRSASTRSTTRSSGA